MSKKAKEAKRSVGNGPPLGFQFCCSGTPEELEVLYSNSANIHATEGTPLPPLWVSIEHGNALLAEKIFEYESGVANFENCGIKSIPIAIIAWLVQHSPKEVVFSNNQLDSLPVELRFLKKVRLQGNPLGTIPQILHDAKWSKIKHYLGTLVSKSSQWDVRKLLIVGEEGVGKTTLVKALKSKSKTTFHENVATDGVDITDIQLQSDQREISFNTYDFAGQVLFYPIHQFFLSNIAIYLLVFHLARMNLQRIEYWMKHIKELTQNHFSPIILVGTHSDLCTSEEINERIEQIKGRFTTRVYPDFQMIIPVSSRTGGGIKELKISLMKLALHSQLSPVIPIAWVRIYEVIKFLSNSKEYIHWEEYVEWTRKCDIKDRDIDVVTEHLCNTGSITYFKESQLKDMVILRPQWLAQIMSCLITLKPSYAKNGFLSSNNIKKVFSDYPDELHPFMIKLLEKFKIVCPIAGDQYLIPSLLSNTRPTEKILKLNPSILPDNRKSYGRVFQFKQLPVGLAGRLIVAMIQITNIRGLVFWEDGIIATYINEESDNLGNEHHQYALKSTLDIEAINLNTLKVNDMMIILIEMEERNYQLNVQLRFPKDQQTSAIKLWRQLLETVRTLLVSFYKSLDCSVEQYIPCIHCLRKGVYQEKVHLFSYQECDRAFRERIPFVYCRNIESPSRTVMISELAPDIYLVDFPQINESNIKIVKEIGEGSYSKVYLAMLGDKEVAVKELKLTLANDEIENYKYRQFQSEAYLMSILDHPNIVKFHGILANPPRLVMEYLPKGDLFSFLHPTSINGVYTQIDSKQFAWKSRLKLALSIAKGLNYLHSISPPVAHLDLRSPNIFLKSEEEGVIGDFGLARLVQGGNLGGVMRTWKWLPPEAFNIHNTQYDQRADIYSYGIFLWELATLTIPFDEYSKHPKYSINGNVVVLTIKKAIIDEDLRPSIPNDTLASYSQLIHKCWQRDPSKRPHPEQIIKQLIWILTSEYGKDAIPGDHDADDEFSLDLSHSNSNNSNDSSLLESSHHNSGDELNHLSSSSSTQLQVKHNLFVVQKNEHVDVASILPLVQMSFEETITSMIVVKNHMWIATLKGNIIVAKLSLETSSAEIEEVYKVHFPRISIIYSHEIEKIISASEDGTIIVWSPLTLKMEGYYTPLALSKSKSMFGSCMLSVVTINSERLWVASPIEGKIFLFNYSNFELVESVTHDSLLGVKQMVYCKGYVWMISGQNPANKIVIFIADTLEFLGEFIASDGDNIEYIKPLHDGRVWAFSGSMISVWESPDPKSLSCIRKITNTQERVNYAHLTRNSNLLLTAGDDGTVLMWNISKFKAVQELEVKGSKIINVNEDQRQHLYVTTSHQISIWENCEDFNLSTSPSPSSPSCTNHDDHQRSQKVR